MVTVRCVARRLGGSLLKRTLSPVTSPAVAEDRHRHFLPRLVHTQRHAAASPESIREAMRAVQEQKEDLYDLISLTEVGHRRESENRQLLRDLSAQIEPRPDDHQWCVMRAIKRAQDIASIAKYFFGFFLGVVCLSLWYDPAEQNEASPTVNKKKQQVDAT